MRRGFGVSQGSRNGAIELLLRVRAISVEALRPSDTFEQWHNSPTPEEQVMAEACGFASMDALIDATVPKSIRRLAVGLSKYAEGLAESQMLAHFKALAAKNKVLQSYMGMGYYNTFLPLVILCNILENPGWFAQGRLESLLNFQTIVADLMGMPMSMFQCICIVGLLGALYGV